MALNESSSSLYSVDSAAEQSMACCRVCFKLSDVSLRKCERCGSSLTLRKKYSVQITVALLVTAVLFYIPANLLPIMTTTTFGATNESTIIGGVVLFLEHKSYFVAFVIFIASIFIPLAKIAAMFWLCFCCVRRKKIKKLELTRLYRITEFIGKWSMIDIFVVAILIALVQITGLMTIEPGLAARAFACVVILTMVAAQQFDIRLIWDRLDDQ